MGAEISVALEAIVHPVEVSQGIHKVIASSFADPADVRAFKRCKAQGKTDQECFRVGDNGVGCWGMTYRRVRGRPVRFP